MKDNNDKPTTEKAEKVMVDYIGEPTQYD